MSKRIGYEAFEPTISLAVVRVVSTVSVVSIERIVSMESMEGLDVVVSTLRTPPNQKTIAKVVVLFYSNLKALTESAFPDSQERDGGWCEPGELTETAVAPELEGRKQRCK